MDESTSDSDLKRDSDSDALDSRPARGILYGVFLGVLAWMALASIILAA